MEHDLNILMIFVITEKCILLTHTMYYKYTRAAYDCVCAPGTHMLNKLKCYFFFNIFLRISVRVTGTFDTVGG